MKKLLLLAVSFITFQANAQHTCAHSKQQYWSPARHQLMARQQVLAAQTSHELKYDVKFVHLDLSLQNTNKNIAGNVKTMATVHPTGLDTFMTILHQNHTIDSIFVNGVKYTALRQDSSVKVGLSSPLPSGAQFTAQVYYHGTAPSGGSAIGSGFSNGFSGAWGNQVTWSLSESFVAYHWWPCKQLLTDKIDSSWVFVTTDSTSKVGSNGILRNVVNVPPAKKRYEWKSRYPIDYYLISVAVTEYQEYNLYAKPKYLANDSILIQNYIYPSAFNSNSWKNSQKPSLDQMPTVMNFLCEMYGMYPFHKEKYGHAMAPFSGGMEHQTMTSLGFFDYYLNAHELGHQWWGDNVTCKSWGDIWINEGFASYTEHLVAQYLDPSSFQANLNAAHNNVMALPGGSIHFTDTMNTNRIFSSRLTYDKGGAIVHSLRFLTNNDSLWFNTLRGFQKTYQDGTASALDFQNYYHTQTGIDPTQFFAQWYYGQGYPTFDVTFNSNGSQCFIRSQQTVSFPSATPLFITPMEYRISRTGKPDTVVRVTHANAVEIYTLPIAGDVISVGCDPNNWVINKTVGPTKDPALGTPAGRPHLQRFNSITVQPNPAREKISISNPLLLQGQVVLRDLSGRVILVVPLSEESQQLQTTVAPGLYLLEITDDKGFGLNCTKIVIE